MAPAQLDAEVMPKIVNWLSVATLGLVGVVWRMLNTRISAVESEAKGKAAQSAVDRQSGHIGKLFDELKEVRQEVGVVERRVSESELRITREMGEMERRLIDTMRETVSDRRERAR